MPRTRKFWSIVVTAALVSGSVATGTLAVAEEPTAEPVEAPTIEVVEPEVVEPEVIEPEVTEPVVAEPESAQPVAPTVDPTPEPTLEPTLEPTETPTADPVAPRLRRAFGGTASIAMEPVAAELDAGSTLSIGNRVWFDDGSNGAGGVNASQRNNGLHDSNERGVNGVRVELYRDDNTNGVPEAGEYVAFDITGPGTAGAGRPGADVAGYYLFDGLDESTYIVVIPASEFGAGKPLAGWHSSTFNGTQTLGAPGATGTPSTDLDDTGIEPANRRPDVSGVRSAPIALTATGSTTGETDLSLQSDPDGNPASPNEGSSPTEWDGPQSIGRGLATDAGSDVAVDFGFVPPMSIGNRVWLDDSSDPAQWSPGGSRNNGLIDATDDGNLAAAGIQNAGIANVDLQLYSDDNNNASIDGGDTLVGTTTTSATGHYLFDGLAPGTYLVRVPSNEFGAGQPLNGLGSNFDQVAQVNPTNQTDSNDNGIDNATPATNGIMSRQIQLTYLAESTGETDLAAAGTPTTIPGPQSRGRNGETDDDSDLTIDFGFLRPALSIGNQVWLDDHATNQSLRNNGIFDTGETAIAGVEIALYRDLNANCVVNAGEDTGFRDTTDANGFYFFGNLPVGSYIVAVTEANFNAGGPLAGTISSRSIAPNPAASDNQTDNNDNGADVFVTGVGVISSRISLDVGTEPTNEASASVNDPTDGVGGRGSHGERNNDSDLTIDFGFFVPQSLGNRVWLDDSANPDNAVLDVASDDLDNPNIAGIQGLGVAGVSMRLYRDLDADGVVDAGEDTGRTASTNASGYYLFDGISRGNYIVGVEASNFAAGGPLAGFYGSMSSTLPTDNGTDNVDDGVGSSPSPIFGVISPSIALSWVTPTTGLEPLASTETDPTPQTQANRGSNGELDSMSNLTVDFGFSRVPMSLGNQVWLDENSTNAALSNNGVFDAGESPLPSVTVDLYLDANADSTPDGAILASTTTNVDGFYLFSALPAGGYLVAVSSANFSAGGPLEGLISSRSIAPNPLAVDNQVDNHDNGRDSSSSHGVLSNRVVLSPGTEPAGESPANGRGTHGELDADSDLTVDFGFYTPFALGDTVWIDDSASPASWADRNNAARDAGESPAASVALRLYRDLDSDGAVDAGEDTGRTATTDALGHYLFTDLARGNYIVGVEPSNFAEGGPLAGYASSFTTGIPTDDGVNDIDHGIAVTPSSSVGIVSPSIVLDSDTVSVDFGFTRTALSLGNQVWLDFVAGDDAHNYNGILDGSEAGIAGVEVALYRDLDTDGTVDAGESTGLTATTDANGFYLFDNLPAGGYLVVVTAGNFAAGEPLHNRMSSPADAAADGTDGDDDGISTLAGTGVVSSAVTLSAGISPTNETPTNGRGSHGETDTDSDLTIDFAFVPASVSVGDTVWADVDEDGVKDAGESGIAGVELTLTDSEGDPVVDVFGVAVAPVTTDADGAYLFAGLPVLAADESYTVTIDSASSALVGFATTGSSESLTTGDLAVSGDADLDLDFAFVPLVGVGDQLWIDSDRDGIQDVTETGPAGVVVKLLTATGAAAVDAFGAPVGSAVSDADGHYAFGDLRPGDYRVEFAPISGYDFTATGAGTSSTDSDADATTGISPVFTVEPSVAGDTKAVVSGDDVGDAQFVNGTIDAGYRLVQYDISMVKEFGAADTSARRITWDFTVANAGPDASAAMVVVTDVLDSKLTFVSGGSADFPCTEVHGTVTCEHPGGLASAESFEFSIVTSYTGYPTTLSNSATVAGGAADTAALNDSSSAVVPTGTLPKPPMTPKPPVTPTTPTAPGTPGSSGSVDATPSPTPTVEPTPEPTPSATESPLPVPAPSASQTPSDTAVAAELPWGWIIGTILALLLLIGAAVFIFRRR